MMVFKRKQIVVLSLVLMIVVAGYLQYSYKKSSITASGNETGKLGDAVYVENTDSQSQAAKDTKENKDAKPTTASKQANDFFAQARLDKEITISKDKDSLKAIVDDKNASKEIRNKAYEQMMDIVSNSEKELRIETLIKEKGFSDVAALFGDDGSIDVVIKSPSLNTAQIAQISDIVSRQANVKMSSIHVRNMY